MTERILDRVRHACREVVRRAQHVAIDQDALRAYARDLPQALTLPRLDPRCHLLDRGADTATFMLALEAVNFGAAYFPELRPYDGLRGYFAVSAALRDRFVGVGVPTSRQLAAWTWEDCAHIFGQDPSHPPARELMTLFARALNEVGEHLLARHDGSAEQLILSAHGSADRLVALLVEMPTFADIARYGDLDVPLLKRAQIAAADLSLAFEGLGPGRFHDLDRLTSFADDQVPHVLHTDGVLRYSEALRARIAAGEFLVPGSAEEIEIRASGIMAVEGLVAGLNAGGRPACAMEVDYLLWNRGLDRRYAVSARHRCRSRFY